jgi:APA family basic amino acid/polyamine antiporter
MVVITIILIVGIRESAITNAILTLVKLCVVVFVVGLGVTLVNQEQNNWTDVPYTQRLSSAELLADKKIAERVRGDRAPGELTDADKEQIKNESAFVRARLGLDRLKRNTAELVAAGTLTQAEADTQLADAQKLLETATAKIGDPAQFEEVIAQVEKDAKNEAIRKWGLLGKIITPETLKPIDDAVRSNFAPYGFSGIMLGAAIVFFAFIGFDSISTHSEEAIRPQRDVPLAILSSLAICTVLYVLVAAVITGMEPYPEIDRKAAIAEAFSRQAELHQSGPLRLSSLLIATGALAGMTSVLLVTFLSQARIFLAMARDKLLPPAIFGAVHPRFKTPHISTALTGFVICVVAAFTPIEKLEEMVNIGTLFAFVIVCMTVLILRIRDPKFERPFRCPVVYLVAPLGILVNVAMMLFLPVDTWLRLVIWMGVGLVFYFSYGYRHSILGRALVHEIAKEGIAPNTRHSGIEGPRRE